MVLFPVNNIPSEGRNNVSERSRRITTSWLTLREGEWGYRGREAVSTAAHTLPQHHPPTHNRPSPVPGRRCEWEVRGDYAVSRTRSFPGRRRREDEARFLPWGLAASQLQGATSPGAPCMEGAGRLGGCGALSTHTECMDTCEFRGRGGAGEDETASRLVQIRRACACPVGKPCYLRQFCPRRS